MFSMIEQRRPSRGPITAMAFCLLASTVPQMALASEGGMPQLNVHDFAPQLVWLAILFTVFYLIVSKIALPGIESVLVARQAKIDGDLSAAAKFKDEAEAALRAYEAALADARAKASKTIGEKAAALAAQSDALKKSLEGELSAKLAAAADEIRAKRASALANVRTMSGEITGQIVTRLLGSAPANDAIDQAVGQILARTAKVVQ
jgi:F-type H+-transporting ATPase subunit b